MSIGETSRAAVTVGVKATELRAFPLPETPTDAGLMRVEGTGICGSDWSSYQSDRRGVRIMGHEMVGTIVTLGDAARERWGMSEGDLVAVEEYLPCGHCDYCLDGEYRSCLETDGRVQGPNAIRYGTTSIERPPSLWGGYSQYVYLHPRSKLHRVPPGVSVRVAAMALPIGNGFQWAYFDCGVGPGKIIVIQGPGQQGLGAVVASRLAGADQVIVSGLKRDEYRLDLARALGADHVVVADEQNLEEEVRRITGGRMADISIDASAAGPTNINPSLGLVRKRGIVAIVSSRGPVLSFDLDQVSRKQISVRGLRGHSFHAVELALRTMASGRFPLERISTHVVGLEDVDTALRMVGGEIEDRSIHITVDPWK